MVVICKVLSVLTKAVLAVVALCTVADTVLRANCDKVKVLW